MITGIVEAAEARICITVVAPGGREQEIDAVIDTGYTASLTLPSATVRALGLRWEGVETFTLADGTRCTLDVYLAKVRWDGKVRTIYVDDTGTEALVGMRLLKGHELNVQVRARGKVIIKRLRRK
jgi:clan AA aspartic protease